MINIFTADISILDNLTFEKVAKYIKLHKAQQARYDKMDKYYRGEHDILSRTKQSSTAPNNKIVCNHAKTIVDTAAGYFIGNPVSYTGKGTERLLEWFDIADIGTVDMDIAKSMGIYGHGFELVNMSADDEPTPKSYYLEPQNTFVVYDDTVEHNPLFAVYYYPVYNDKNEVESYKVNVSTDTDVTKYDSDKNLSDGIETGIDNNPFGMVPVIEYSNNREQQGDFEQVISLIDAYNLLMSDRVNDKEQFVDSILLLINARLGDTLDEENEVINLLREHKLLDLPEDSDARYLTRTFDEAGVEILRKTLEQDIHKFANIPCLSDENFVGNASGVAMEYKLLGLEMITKIKERNFKRGVRRRIALYGTIQGIKGGAALAKIDPVFTRGLPKNLVELANIITQLENTVPLENLLSLLPFITDVHAAIEKLKEQKAENAKTQQDTFGMTKNTPPDGEDDEE